MSNLETKPELRHCSKCGTHTPHILVTKNSIEKQKQKKFCLVCCRKTNVTEKDISQLEPRCEYCSSPFAIHCSKNGHYRRFCSNGRCAVNQHKFIKLWQDKTHYQIAAKITELRQRLIFNQNYDTLDDKMKKKYPLLTEMKIGTIHNQIAMLFNIKETQKKLIQVSSR